LSSRGFRITTLHAFICRETADDEGLVAIQVGGLWFPLIAADERRVESLRPKAQQIAAETGKRIELVRFVRGQVLETYGGRKS